MTNLDFIPNLNNKLNTMNLFAKSDIGLLGIGESLSVLALPGARTQVFYDGTYDTVYSIQINAKSRSQARCMEALNIIFQGMQNVKDIPSENGSYVFNDIDITSLPAGVGSDESGFHIWQISLEADLTILGGNE